VRERESRFIVINAKSYSLMFVCYSNYGSTESLSSGECVCVRLSVSQVNGKEEVLFSLAS